MTDRLFRFPVVHAVLHEPIREEDGPGEMSFYARAYLVWAADSAAALEMIRQDIDAEATLLSSEPPNEVEPASLELGMRQQAQASARPGVCWRSGRIFYPPE